MPNDNPVRASTVGIITIGPRVEPPPGIVYSTDPKQAECDDGHSYFVKGPQLAVVFAEAAGCLLASRAGIPVPAVALCRHGDLTLVGSLSLRNAVRNIEPWLKSSRTVANYGDLVSTLVVDLWLANPDRNLGNVLGQGRGSGPIHLTMIDFEKCATLHGPNPFMDTAAIEDRKFWPTGVLGDLLRRQKELRPPQRICEAIKGVPEIEIRAILEDLSGTLGGVPWLESSVSRYPKISGGPMGASLMQSLQTYRLLYFSPEPETGERVCIGLLFSQGSRHSLVFDERFPKLRCIAPGFEPSLVVFYLRDLDRELQRISPPDAETVLRTYGSQLQVSAPREIVQPLSESLKVRLLTRFALKADDPSSIARAPSDSKDPSNALTSRLREYVQEFQPASDYRVMLRPTAESLFHSKHHIRPVAFALASSEKAILVDGVDLDLCKPNRVVNRTNEIVHIFWQYRRLREERLDVSLQRVGLLLNGTSKWDERKAEAHDYARDQLKRETDVFVDQHTGTGLEEFKRALTAAA